jgi:Na+/proline symporter
MNPVLFGVFLYVVLQFAIGIWVSRRIKTEDDYFVAGRRLGLGLSTFSIFATWFGAETCVGAAGAMYAEGLSRTSVEPFAYGICLIVMGIVFAAPFWRAKVITLADLFRRRFSPAVERFAAVLLIPTSVLWAAAQIHAFGQVVSAASEMAPALGISIAAVLVVLYTTAGGMMSDVITDFVQTIAITLGLGALTFGVVAAFGGLEPFLGALEKAPANVLAREGPGLMDTLEAWAIPICGSVVAQEALSRAVSSRSANVARTSVLLGGTLYVAIGLMPVVLGLVGPQLLPDLTEPERILPDLAKLHLPTLGYVLFLGAIVSAILSTVDSTLLVASSLLSRNVLMSAHGDFSQKRRVLQARLCVAGFGVVAWLLALSADSVLERIEDASGFGSAGILVVVSFGLFSRFGGARSALASLAAGIVVWILGRYLVDGWPWPYLCSLAAALAAYVGVAAFERSPAGASSPAAAPRG